MPEIHGEITTKTLGGVLHGEVRGLGVSWREIEAFEDKWRGKFFSEVRQEEEDPDIRSVWEPARLQHVTVLMEHLRRGDCGEAEEIRRRALKMLLDWIEGNPFTKGPHYMSVMECGLRIPVFFMALKELAPGPEEKEKILEALYRHAWLTHKRLSLYSSLGNHTVAECLGLVFAGAVFRNHSAGRRWLRRGAKHLHRECIRQVLPDGGPLEQSFGYHRFVLDMLLLAADFLEDNGLKDCTTMRRRLELGEKFLRHVSSAEGPPNTGDDDAGRAVAPGLYPCRPAAEVGPGSLMADWRLHVFPESGYTTARHENGIFLCFYHGRLGMPPLFNHGHADALSVVVNYDGKPFLVDPGTFRYNGARRFRAYLKGTRAHNTVTVDGRDQAEQLTGFIWRDTYAVRSLKPREEGGVVVLEASHDGYERLDAPVRHVRRLRLEKSGRIVLEDSFEGSGEHVFELNYHLHPETEVISSGTGVLLRRQQRGLEIRFGEGGFEVFEGSESPPAGWYSGIYGELRQSKTLSRTRRGECGGVLFETVLQPTRTGQVGE